MNTPALKASWLALATVALAACSAGKDDPGENGGTSGVGNAPGSGGLLLGNGGTTGSGGLLPTSGGQSFGAVSSKGGSGGGKSGEECPSVSQSAEKILGGKADIIWAIDTSGSMIEELTAVQDNMNAFSQFILGTGIDVHVIAVAIGVRDFLGFPAPGLCIAPPLGSGASCFNAGDTRDPVYLHLDEYVDSHNALERLIATYPKWQPAIRTDSTKTFVVVSDDEAQGTTAAAFKSFFDNAWQGSTWRFSGIFCKIDGGNCAGAGMTYDQLVTETGGIWADLSNPTPDWNAVFKQLGDAVVADAKPVDCQWKIPPAPTGQTFDKEKVNVDFTPTSGIKETIFQVDSKDACQDPAGGWYYDSDATPTTVLACPQSCTKIQADNNAKIDVAFGCPRRRPIM